jgi:hypothetical protein
MRLQVPPLVGLVVDPTKEPQEPTTVTPAEIIYHRRVQVLDDAGQTSVTEACRTFGVSRTTDYRWAGRAQRYGLAALLPKGRRPPAMPTATPADQVEAVLAEAVARPTLGARPWSITWPSVGCAYLADNDEVTPSCRVASTTCHEAGGRLDGLTRPPTTLRRRNWLVLTVAHPRSVGHRPRYGVALLLRWTALHGARGRRSWPWTTRRSITARTGPGRPHLRTTPGALCALRGRRARPPGRDASPS